MASRDYGLVPGTGHWLAVPAVLTTVTCAPTGDFPSSLTARLSTLPTLSSEKGGVSLQPPAMSSLTGSSTRAQAPTGGRDDQCALCSLPLLSARNARYRIGRTGSSQQGTRGGWHTAICTYLPLSALPTPVGFPLGLPLDELSSRMLAHTASAVSCATALHTDALASSASASAPCPAASSRSSLACCNRLAGTPGEDTGRGTTEDSQGEILV